MVDAYTIYTFLFYEQVLYHTFSEKNRPLLMQSTWFFLLHPVNSVCFSFFCCWRFFCRIAKDTMTNTFIVSFNTPVFQKLFTLFTCKDFFCSVNLAGSNTSGIPSLDRLPLYRSAHLYIQKLLVGFINQHCCFCNEILFKKTKINIYYK